MGTLSLGGIRLHITQWAAILILTSPFVPAGSGEEAFKVSHSPKQPKSGEEVTITMSAARGAAKGDLLLQYQLVEPGKYIAFGDPAYETEWTNVELTNPTESQSGKARVILTARLPAKLQEHRRLIRYRFYSRESKAIMAPGVGDKERNFSYFVYDGIPEWRGAIHPGSSPPEGDVRTFPSEVMRSIQAYHLIAKQEAVENVTWREQKRFGAPDRHEYYYTATLVSDGKVYDHVRFRARGGNWRYAMGKNMWKIDFNKGHHLEARDDRGQRYESKWNKVNLGACIQQADYGMRGEHGLLEAVTYRLFNLAGVEAPRTHWAQLRIIDGVEESPANQYDGDFWGLYLATEEVDDTFLKEHSLPDGNLYKMDFGSPDPEYISPAGPPDGSDVLAFISGLRTPQRPDWWRTNVDLAQYYSYRAIVESVHHYDIGQGKNYFFYHNLKARRWQVIPWDVDLTWGDQMYGTGAEPFFRAGILRAQPFKTEYDLRLAEIRDLLFNPEQTGQLIDEYAAIINDPNGSASIVHADRAKWDYHPIMSSQFVIKGKADPGRFYENSPTHDFPGMVGIMKDYVQKRGEWIDETLLANARFAPTPKISVDGKLNLTAAKLNVQLAPYQSAVQVKWRLAEVGPPSKQSSAVGELSGRYEITPLWEAAGSSNHAEVPTALLKAARQYRVRACARNWDGLWSRWSEPLEISVPERRQAGSQENSPRAPR